MAERVMIFVDAPNLERGIKQRYQGYYLNHTAFFQKLTNGHELISVHWFDTELVKSVNPTTYHTQQKFWHRLQQENPKLHLHKGSLRHSYEDGKNWEEEGVDASLSQWLSLEVQRYDKGIILTADGDQDSALRTLQGDPWNKKFALAILDYAPSYKLRRTCDEVIEMTSDWLDPLWRRRPNGLTLGLPRPRQATQAAAGTENN